MTTFKVTKKMRTAAVDVTVNYRKSKILMRLPKKKSV